MLLKFFRSRISRLKYARNFQTADHRISLFAWTRFELSRPKYRLPALIPPHRLHIHPTIGEALNRF